MVQEKVWSTLDHSTEAIVTIGSKEGLGHLAMATVDKGDVILVPNPAYPIHPFGFVISGADIRHVPIGPNINCLLYTSPSPRDRQKSRMPSSA